MFNHRNILFFSLFLALLFAPQISRAASTTTTTTTIGTSVSGSITNPVWTEANSPYVINGIIDVAPGAKLVIQPGTVVKFNTGAGILVEGELDAVGTADKQITFTSNQTSPQKGDWAGIYFTKGSVNATVAADGTYSSGSIIKYANIKYSQGIFCNDAVPFIASNTLLSNKMAIELIGSSTSAGMEVTDLNESIAKHANLVTAYIVDNTMSDNDFGIIVQKSNGRDYINTPAGTVYLSKKFTTAIIKNNKINSNASGIVITKGDNNLILNNEIKFNTNEGLHLEGGSDNFIQGNTINNNSIGITNSALNTVIIANDVEYNFVKGLDVKAIARSIKYNNIDNNKAISLNNNIGNMDVSGNYWGAIQDDSSANVANVQGTATIDPYLSSAVDITALTAPVVDVYASVTDANVAALSGIKLIGSNLFNSNGTQVTTDAKNYEWAYNMSLDIGTNTQTFYLGDSSGKKGPGATVAINRAAIVTVNAPAINSYATSTASGSVVLGGSKQAGTGIWFNSKKVIDINSNTAWTYTLSLVKGENTVNISAQDANGVASQPIIIAITRTEISDQTVIDAEKQLTTKIDTALTKKLSGRLLLQIENKGYVWYVNPKNGERYYVNATNALNVWRALAVGITEKNLNLMPTKAGTKVSNQNLVNSLKGKFVLRVQASGKISYIDVNGLRHDVDASSIMKILTSLSLGISNQNIRKIAVGSL